MRDFKPDAVIGTGGYVCFPVLKAASDLKIPTAVHESNAVPGLTTKMLAKKMDRIMGVSARAASITPILRQ